jgi:hypothetical protein
VALTSAPSVHINGHVITTRSNAAGYDVQMNGRDGIATITQDGVSLKFIRLDGFLYVKLNSDIWKAQGGEAAVKLMKGKYLKVPISDPRFEQWAGYFSPARLIQGSKVTHTNGGTKVVNGVNTISIVDPDPQNGGTLYIAVQGADRGRPIRLEGVGGRTSLDFTYPEKPVNVDAPPANQVDLTQFEQLTA